MPITTEDIEREFQEECARKKQYVRKHHDIEAAGIPQKCRLVLGIGMCCALVVVFVPIPKFLMAREELPPMPNQIHGSSKRAHEAQRSPATAVKEETAVESKEAPLLVPETEEDRETQAIQSSIVVIATTTPRPDPFCKLPPIASVYKFKKTKDANCIWQWTGKKGKCVYALVGNCQPYHHKTTNCTFWGAPHNQQRNVDWFFLPEAKGEINMTAKEKAIVRKPFQPCDSRPKFWMITSKPLASPENPLHILAGGGASLAQHIYYVEGEVAGDDVYQMSKQKPENMKVIVDLGGNIGLFAISACKRFPKSRIISFEPHPGNYRFLVYNVAAAGCTGIVETINKGVSQDGRSMKLFWHDSIATSAYRGPTAWKPETYPIRMETITPDEMWRIIGAQEVVSLMKVDCEGCEYEVIPHIPQWRVEKMFCEVHLETVNILEGHTAVKGMTKQKMKQVEQACKRGKPFNTNTLGMPDYLQKGSD